MPTKTTKKPKARKEALSLKSRVDSLARALEALQCTVNGEVWDVDSLKADMQEHINKLSKEEFKNLEIRYDRHIDDLRQYVGRSFSDVAKIREQDVTAHNVLANQVEVLQNESVKAWGMLGEHRGALADMKGKIADIASIIPSCLKDTAELKKTVGVHDAQLEINFSDVRRTQGLHKERLDKIDERMNMAECDIEKIFDPTAFGRDAQSAVTSKDVVSILQSAKHRVASYQNTSAMSAIIFCTFPGELRSRVLLAMYIAVHSIWCMPEQAPTVLTDEVISQLLYEWHDGMVVCKEDVLLAFNVAIKKETLRA